jgi:GT2 family glycosyltransferase
LTDITIAIPTRNRPQRLQHLLRSIQNQSVSPNRVLIIDDSDPPLRPSVRRIVKETLPAARLIVKDEPGLTSSRNTAADACETSLIVYFDDDVLLDPRYLEEIEKEFLDPSVTGVGGVVVNEPEPRHPFLGWLAGVSGPRRGTVYRSGWASSIPKSGSTQFLSGCNMSYRAEVVRRERFDEKVFLGYGFGEDLEFSYRLCRLGHLLRIATNARVWHHTEPKPFAFQEGYHEVTIRPLIVGPSFSRGRYAVTCISLALLAYLRGAESEAHGIWKGMRQVLRNSGGDSLGL